MLVDDEREKGEVLIRDNVTYRLIPPHNEMTAVDKSFVSREYLGGFEALRIVQGTDEPPIKVYSNANRIILLGKDDQGIKRIFFSPSSPKRITMEEIGHVDDLSLFGSGHIIVPSTDNIDVGIGKVTVTEQVTGRIFVEERGTVRVVKGDVPRVIIGNSGSVDVLAGTVMHVVDGKPKSGIILVQKDPFQTGSRRTVVSKNMPSVR